MQRLTFASLAHGENVYNEETATGVPLSKRAVLILMNLRTRHETVFRFNIRKRFYE